MTDGPHPDERPIGWWLREADRALDGAVDVALRGTGVDRRGWQVLASLARRPMPADELLASLAGFDEPGALEATVADLWARGWVETEVGRLRLTTSGAERRQELAPRVDEVRGAVSAALPPADYAQLVALLDRLIAGLRPPG